MDDNVWKDWSTEASTVKLENSDIHSNWSSDLDFDSRMTDRIKEMMDDINSYLYAAELSKVIKEASRDKISTHLVDECGDWTLLFKYLRISGTQMQQVQDLGYEIINLVSMRNSPYLYYPYLGDHGLEARGFRLGQDAFRARHDLLNCDSNDCKLDIQIDLGDIITKCVPEHNICLLISYYYDTGNSFPDDRPRTPTLSDPKGERKSENIERLRLVECRKDGLSGIQDYLSKESDSKDLQFVLVFLNSIKNEECLNLYFVSWDKDSWNSDSIHNYDLLNASQDFMDFSFNIVDLDNYFPNLPITFYYKNYAKIKDFKQETESSLRSSAHFYQRKTNRQAQVHDEYIIVKDGSVDEWLAFDNGKDESLEIIKRKGKRSIEEFTPNHSILEDAISHIFDDFWPEISPSLEKIATKLIHLKSQIKKKTFSTVSGSSRREGTMSEHSGSTARKHNRMFQETEDSTILDTLEIDDLIRRPNLLNAMTIRSIPLQKRDPKIKLGAHEAITTENLNMNLPFSIKRSQNLRDITARPNSGLNLKSGSSLGQRSAVSKRNNINMRLMPIPYGSSSHHGSQNQNMKEILIATGDTKSSMNQIPKPLPPIKPILLHEFNNETSPKAYSHRHITFDEGIPLESKLVSFDERPRSAKRQPSAFSKKVNTLISRPHTAMDESMRRSMGRFSKTLFKEDSSVLNPVLAYFSKSYRRKPA